MTSVSNAAWPPDLSQLAPDLVVALVTGVIVGLVVLFVERGSQSRRARADELSRRRSVVRKTSIRFPFVFSGRGLLPTDEGLSRLVTEVAPTGGALFDGLQDEPGYEFLVRVSESREAMQSAIDEIDRVIQSSTLSEKSSARRRLRSSIVNFATRDLIYWDPAQTVPGWEELRIDQRHVLCELMTSEDLDTAVGRYADARRDLEAWRKAYVATREHVRRVNATGRDLLMLARVGQTRAERRDAMRRAHLLRRHLHAYSRLAGIEAYCETNPGGTWFPYDARHSSDHPGLREPATVDESSIEGDTTPEQFCTCEPSASPVNAPSHPVKEHPRTLTSLYGSMPE